MAEDWQERNRRIAREHKERSDAQRRESEARMAENRRRQERDDDRRRQDQAEKRRRDDAVRALRESERHNQAMEDEARATRLSAAAAKATASGGLYELSERRLMSDSVSNRNRAYRAPRRSRLPKLIILAALVAISHLLWPTISAIIADTDTSPSTSAEPTPQASTASSFESDTQASAPKHRAARRAQPYYPPCSATVVDHCKEPD